MNGAPPPWAGELMARVERAPDEKITAKEMMGMGVTPERARRWFMEHYGMTFAEWQRGKRLAEAFTQIRNGDPLDDVVFANGYESHSGFREAFSKTFGAPPMKARENEYIAVEFIETPLGPILAAAVRGGHLFCRIFRPTPAGIQLQADSRNDLGCQFCQRRTMLWNTYVPN